MEDINSENYLLIFEDKIVGFNEFDSTALLHSLLYVFIPVFGIFFFNLTQNWQIINWQRSIQPLVLLLFIIIGISIKLNHNYGKATVHRQFRLDSDKKLLMANYLSGHKKKERQRIYDLTKLKKLHREEQWHIRKIDFLFEDTEQDFSIRQISEKNLILLESTIRKTLRPSENNKCAIDLSEGNINQPNKLTS